MEIGIMNKNRRVIIILAIAAAFLAAVGCTTGLNPANFIPDPIKPAENDKRINGSVNIQAFVPDVSNDKVYLFDSSILRTALEKAIAKNELFQLIGHGNADYVIDVWIVAAKRTGKLARHSRGGLSYSGSIVEMNSIWRLTRTRDGKAMICGLNIGRGESHGVVFDEETSMERAVQGMIREGLRMLSAKWDFLPGESMYAGDWPSMGPVMTESYKKLKENWSMLRKGMTEAEVLKLLPSVNKIYRRETLEDNGTSVIVKYLNPYTYYKNEKGVLREVSAPYALYDKIVFKNGGLYDWAGVLGR
jgi:hypothetical protein